MIPVPAGVVFTGFIPLDTWDEMTPDEQAAAFERKDAYFFAIEDPEFRAALDKFRGYEGSYPQLAIAWNREG
jgi:hypothetical protein